MRIRAETMPSSPKNYEEIVESFENPCVFQCFGTAFNADDPHFGPSSDPKGYTFFKHARKTDKFSWCMFASDRSIDLMNRHCPIAGRRICIDGTFKVSQINSFLFLSLL